MAEDVKPRPYRSPLRADLARETRRRIRAAAEATFLEGGYLATSMDDIARVAGVSRQTIFTAFGSKAGVLKEILDVRLVGDEAPIPLLERPVARRIATARDAAEAIRLLAKLGTEVAVRVAPLWTVLVVAAATDPSIAELQRSYDSARLEGVGTLTDLLARRGFLAPARSRRKVKEAITLLTGPAMVSDAQRLGWSTADIERWLADCLTGVLLSRNGSTS